MKNKMVLVISIFALIIIFSGKSFVLAEDDSNWSNRDFWKEANDWYDEGVRSGGIQDVSSWGSISAIISEISKIIEVLGTTVIVCVTTFLGIKYMYGSATGKAEVKDSLLTLLVACVFFFGWSSIWKLIFNNGTLTINPSGTSLTGIIANVFSTLALIANILAVGAVIYIGIRYIFAGATGKAELKAKSVQFLIGFILAFCSVTVLSYVSEVVKQVLE